ncbi:MAG: M1 family peptidase, partial [Anaerolineae bacterium]|nr:M1 family peptidase [Anaerolineae bacterium]
GFATYFTHVYLEHTYGPERRKEGMLRDRQQVIRHCAKSPAPVVNSTISNYNELLSPHVYERASWVLHMLRRQLGDTDLHGGDSRSLSDLNRSRATKARLRVLQNAATAADAFLRS